MSPTDCIFCGEVRRRAFIQNDLAYAVRDSFPVTDGHSLIIPFRHVETYFDLSAEEALACNELLSLAKLELEDVDSTVDGFNIGINSGEVAGQTIFHCHIHLIPRRCGDVENPRGGIRHVIPGKGFY